MSTAAIWLGLAALGAAGDPPKDYPRRELLVEVEELSRPEKARGFVVLDARSKDKYNKGHVPQAVWVDHEAWNKTFHKSQDVKEWAKRIGDLGIGNKSKVVVYDDALSKDAARIWWILRYFGHKDARLLNGGFQTWEEAKLPLSHDKSTAETVEYTIDEPETKLLATQADVLTILKEKRVQIIDARSEKEHCGEDKLKNKKAGAIPGAMNLEWTEALDKKTHRFKSPAQLAAMFKNAGIDVSRPTVTHCQSGGRSAVMAFTLELMGANEVAHYYRGWSEWGNSEETPIVIPPKKK